MKRDFIVIAAIADIHLGNKAISWKEYKHQLKNGVLKKLDAMAFLDGIVLCGDISHYQISMNSEYATVYQWFFAKLVKIAKNKNAFIRVFRGTRSHDLDQLETVRQYEDDFDIDFKIYNTATVETINGYNFAFIPEEYIDKSVDKYYSDIFDREDGYFDMIFGHGLIKETQFIEQKSENIDNRAPIFNLKDLYRVCRGPILFGHIHTPMVFGNKFYYIGSTLRTCHGEEEDKGWDVVSYIKDKELYRVDKIVNEFTFNFNKLEIHNKFIEDNEVDAIVNYVEKFIDKNNVDRLSLRIQCIDNDDNALKIELLKKYFAKNKNISTSFKIMSQKAYEKDEKISKVKEKKKYLQDGLDIAERIRLWALEKRNYRIEKDRIMKFITDDGLKRKGV